jgi:hypothetical protein
MPYLQLSENNMYLSQGGDSEYIFIPEGFRGAPQSMYVREDYFDDMPEAMYMQIMDELEQYQPGDGLSFFGKKARERRAARRTERQERKTAKRQQKYDAKQARITARQEGRTKRTEMGGGFAGAIKSIGGTVSSILGGGQAPIDPMDMGGADRFSMDIGPEPEPKKNYLPLIIGGVAAAGLVIFLVTRKK